MQGSSTAKATGEGLRPEQPKPVHVAFIASLIDAGPRLGKGLLGKSINLGSPLLGRDMGGRDEGIRLKQPPRAYARLPAKANLEGGVHIESSLWSASDSRDVPKKHIVGKDVIPPSRSRRRMSMTRA
eukprot:8639884-Alexandrium_andersonii.AAC.1